MGGVGGGKKWVGINWGGWERGLEIDGCGESWDWVGGGGKVSVCDLGGVLVDGVGNEVVDGEGLM